MQAAFRWDIGAHHETPFTDMTREELETTILGIKRYGAAKALGGGVDHLAYPLGRQDIAGVRPLVRKHFETARVAGSGPETLPPADRHLLRAYNVTDKTSPAELGEAIRRAKEHREWLILMLHFLVDEPSIETEYSIDNFKALLQVLADSGIRVLPLTEVWRACASQIESPGSAPRCSFASGVAAPAPD